MPDSLQTSDARGYSLFVDKPEAHPVEISTGPEPAVMMAGQRRGHEDDDKNRRSGNTFWCQAAVGATVFAVICLFLYGSKPAQAAVLPDKAQASVLVELSNGPRPPEPYRYESFMAWLQTADFSSTDFKWKPEVAEFDMDAPLKSGRFAEHLKGPDAAQAVSIAKHINKWLFMGDIMKTGELEHVGGPGTHLYIIQKLAVATAAKGLSQPTFLDAGCGPGYLLLAWSLACGDESNAIGLDLDKAIVGSARRYLSSPEALDEEKKEEDLGSMEVHIGDALRPQPQAVDLEEGSVDAVNVGLAVKSLKHLSALTSLLRPGGLLLAPICLSDSEQPDDVPAGRCEGRLRLFQKSDEGQLVRVPGDPEIPCRFILSDSDPPNLRR